MKKYVLLLGIVCAAFIAKSQAKVELGLKGGLNLNNVSTDEDPGETYKSATGYHFGAYGLIKIANIGIQPEILYSVQGTEISLSGVAGELSQDLKYINIPVMAKLYLVAGLNLQIGPQFGMLVGAKSEEPGGGTTNIKDDLKDSDLSIGLGAGWDAPFGVSVNARYVLGLSDVNDASGEDAIRNRVLQISLGYRLFKLGK